MAATIFIVDDHESTIMGLRAIFRHKHEWRVIGQALTGEEALAGVREMRPDIMILDSGLPDMSGVDVLRKIRKLKMQPKVIVFTGYDDDTLPETMYREGAAGFVRKASPHQEIVRAIERAIAGETYVGSDVGAMLVKSLVESREHRKPEDSKLKITHLQGRLLRWCAEDVPLKDIATSERLGESTVKSHMRRLRKRLGARGRAGLIRYAIEHGYCPGPKRS